jgi:hypothetical protein
VKKNLVLIFVVCVLVGFFLRTRHNNVQRLVPEEQAQPLNSPAMLSPVLPVEKSSEGANILSEKSGESVSITLPDEKVVPLTRDQLRLPSFPNQIKLREELLKNPHITPPVLVEFANNLGPVMEAALKPDASEETLASIVAQLSLCVKADEISMSVRALCYVNLARIYKQHPTMEAADVSRIDVPDRLRQLAEPLLNSL